MFHNTASRRLKALGAPRHLEDHGRRRWPAALIILVVAMFISAVALAIIIVSKTTATETLGLFSGSLANIEPGFTATSCIAALVTTPQVGDLPKWYVAAATGDLADELVITVSENNFEEPTTAGHQTCDTQASHWTSRYSGTLAAFAAAFPSYELGGGWTLMGPNAVELRVILTLPATVDGSTIMGQTASLALHFENRGQ